MTAMTPVPPQTDLAVQNSTTGQVDYLQFTGTTLTASALFSYIAPGWKIVTQGIFPGGGNGDATDLVAQNSATGQLDFLYLDGSGNLVASELSNVPVPKIVGVGNFNSDGQTVGGPVLVSQLPNGELDMLGFSSAGTLVQSDLIANTVGFAPVVGVGSMPVPNDMLVAPAFDISPFGDDDNVVLQLADGSLDVIGFSGSFPNSDNLSMSASLLLPDSAGMPPVAAINQTGGPTDFDDSVSNPVFFSDWSPAVQMVSQLPNGQPDVLYFDSGYYASGTAGTFYASEQMSTPLSGWNVVDASGVAGELFPLPSSYLPAPA